MWLFGMDSYGWRVSNSLLLAISIPFFYYFVRSFLGRTFALFAVVLYGSAHVMLSFGHIGPNNVQAIIVMATSLATFVWASRHGSWAGYVLVGICLGLGFYTFALARIYCLVIAIWLAVYYFPAQFSYQKYYLVKFYHLEHSIWHCTAHCFTSTEYPLSLDRNG